MFNMGIACGIGGMYHQTAKCILFVPQILNAVIHCPCSRQRCQTYRYQPLFLPIPKENYITTRDCRKGQSRTRDGGVSPDLSFGAFDLYSTCLSFSNLQRRASKTYISRLSIDNYLGILTPAPFPAVKPNNSAHYKSRTADIGGLDAL